MDLDISLLTIQRLLKLYRIKKWLAKKRPLLTEQTAALRLQWAKDYVDWTLEQWAKVLFIDECSVERGAGHRRLFVFRSLGYVFDPDKVQT